MLKKISVRDLQVGMHIEKLCGSWMHHPFWRTKFTITDPADISSIRDSGITEVWIDSAKGKDVEAAQPVAAAPAAEPAPAPASPQPAVVPAKRTSMAEEVKRAARICECRFTFNLSVLDFHLSPMHFHSSADRLRRANALVFGHDHQAGRYPVSQAPRE